MRQLVATVEMQYFLTIFCTNSVLLAAIRQLLSLHTMNQHHATESRLSKILARLDGNVLFDVTTMGVA